MLKIRRAARVDRAEVAALQRLSMRALAASHYGAREIDAFLSFATPELGALIEVATVWLACAGDRVVASAAWHPQGVLPAVGPIMPPDPSIAVFRTVFVRPEWTRRGVASTLMDRAEADARSHGVERAKLHAMLNAAGFYRARGYMASEAVVLDLAGTPFAGLAMERDLNDPVARAA